MNCVDGSRRLRVRRQRLRAALPSSTFVLPSDNVHKRRRAIACRACRAFPPRLTIVVLTGSSSVESPVNRLSTLTPPHVVLEPLCGADPIRPETAGGARGLAGSADVPAAASGAKERASRSSSSAWLTVSSASSSDSLHQVVILRWDWLVCHGHGY